MNRGPYGLWTIRNGRVHHTLNEHGLWPQVRSITGSSGDFGPLANLGLIQLWVWNETARAKRFIRSSSPNELATFICLLAEIGQDFLDSNQVAGSRTPVPGATVQCSTG